jgi:hypothetical protein
MTTATESTEPKLAWGLSWAVPEDSHAAWGARAIVEGTGFSLLPDRQSIWSDDDEARKKLIAALNGPLLGTWQVLRTHEHPARGALHHAQERVTALREAGAICGPNGEGGDQDQEHVLYEDDAVKMVGNTNGSFGYLYIAAWLKPEAT